MGFYVTRKQFLEKGDRLRNEVDSALTIIFGSDLPSSSVPRPKLHYRGTASYFEYAGFPCVLTAAHVLQGCPQLDNVFHGKGEESFFPLRSGWYATVDAEVDLAVMGCFQKALEQAAIKPLKYTHFLAPSYNHKDAFYYCNGYPGAHSVNLPFLGEFSIRDNAFIGKAARLPDGVDPSKCFAIEYPCNIDPPGMSGAPVWNLRFHCMQRVEDWAPEAASFAGVAQRWCPETKVLIVTRVEHVRDFIPRAVEHLRTRYKWKDGNEVLEAGQI
ncbi:MAG: serine protease [Nitrospira sp.]|nr:serine protease [Nitrospira sp.]